MSCKNEVQIIKAAMMCEISSWGKMRLDFGREVREGLSEVHKDELQEAD